MPVNVENQEVSEGENLADTLAAIESSLKKLIKSGLNMDAIIILLAEHSKVRRGDVRAVLESLPELRKRYTTK
jgi:predicted AlkP superfamily pyrophosphatase or phosphodiesterase